MEKGTLLKKIIIIKELLLLNMLGTNVLLGVTGIRTTNLVF
jgi:hypothetical protein